MKEIDPAELSQFNGEGGNPIYVAYQGRVFDVSASTFWKGGMHMLRHHAGTDLTKDIQAAPHGPEMLERYSQVAVLKKETGPGQVMPQALSRLLKRFPFLRRHPHPMMVHFPIVFMFSATLFTLLYLITGNESFELTARNCLGAGLIFTPTAMATGYYTWWLNYLSKPLRPVSLKKRLAVILLIVEIIVFSWRIAVPDILSPFGFVSAIYLLLVVSLLPLVIALGWLGAKLTFPIERE